MTVPSDDVAATPSGEEELPIEDQSPPNGQGAPDDQAAPTDQAALEGQPVLDGRARHRTSDSPSGTESRLGDDGDDPSAETASPAADAPQRFNQVRFVGVEMVLPSPHPVLVLREVDAPRRRLEIPIGAAEGIAIAYAARGVPTPRPLTHELFTQVMRAFDVEVATVRITEVVGAAFTAEIVFASPTGARTLSCRPSDGVALALRQQLGVPITVATEVLEVAGN